MKAALYEQTNPISVNDKIVFFYCYLLYVIVNKVFIDLNMNLCVGIHK